MSQEKHLTVVPARYPGRIIGAIVALFILASVIDSVAFNPRWEWRVFARWFFDPVILTGLGQTLLLTLFGTVLSLIFWRPAGAGAALFVMVIEHAGVWLHLAISLAAADCGADHSV